MKAQTVGADPTFVTLARVGIAPLAKDQVRGADTGKRLREFQHPVVGLVRNVEISSGVYGEAGGQQYIFREGKLR